MSKKNREIPGWGKTWINDRPRVGKPITKKLKALELRPRQIELEINKLQGELFDAQADLKEQCFHPLEYLSFHTVDREAYTTFKINCAICNSCLFNLDL